MRWQNAVTSATFDGARAVTARSRLGRDISQLPSGVNAMARPAWRLWRFSLRGLMFVMTGLCVWLGLHINSSVHQRRAVEIIREHGGTVRYSSSLDGRVIDSLIGRIGIDYSYPLNSIRFDRKSESSVPIDAICSLPDLWHLDFAGRTEISDTDLAKLSTLQCLVTLDLSRSVSWFRTAVDTARQDGWSDFRGQFGDTQGKRVHSRHYQRLLALIFAFHSVAVVIVWASGLGIGYLGVAVVNAADAIFLFRARNRAQGFKSIE